MKTISFAVAVLSFTALRRANTKSQMPTTKRSSCISTRLTVGCWRMKTRNDWRQKIRRDGWDRSNDCFSFSALFR